MDDLITAQIDLTPTYFTDLTKPHEWPFTELQVLYQHRLTPVRIVGSLMNHCLTLRCDVLLISKRLLQRAVDQDPNQPSHITVDTRTYKALTSYLRHGRFFTQRTQSMSFGSGRGVAAIYQMQPSVEQRYLKLTLEEQQNIAAAADLIKQLGPPVT